MKFFDLTQDLYIIQNVLESTRSRGNHTPSICGSQWHLSSEQGEFCSSSSVLLRIAIQIIYFTLLYIFYIVFC